MHSQLIFCQDQYNYYLINISKKWAKTFFYQAKPFKMMPYNQQQTVRFCFSLNSKIYALVALNNDISQLHLYQYTKMRGTPRKQKSLSKPTSPSSQSRRSFSPNNDRHIVKFDRTKYDHLSSSSSNKSTSSYQSSLQQTLLTKKSFKQFTLQLSKRQNCSEKKMLKNRSSEPSRIFRVHGWKDDYYTNLLDWSYNNFICAANHNDLYFYNMTVDDELQSSLYRRYSLHEREENLNSIRFFPSSTRIAIGYAKGGLKCFDYFKEQTVIDEKKYHKGRIGTLEWVGGLLFSGSNDRTIKSLDIKSGKQGILLPQRHDQEVCSIRANNHLIASGGNDNKIFIFDIRKPQSHLQTYTHQAAVKGLDWTRSNILISGGGTTDRKIKLWKDGTGVYRQIDTGSQICGIRVSTTTEQFVSCQGFSLNQIIVWNMEGKRQITIHGHENRVLYSALSPSGQCMATGAGDQKLKIWKLFKRKQQQPLEMNQLR